MLRPNINYAVQMEIPSDMTTSVVSDRRSDADQRKRRPSRWPMKLRIVSVQTKLLSAAEGFGATCSVGNESMNLLHQHRCRSVVDIPLGTDHTGDMLHMKESSETDASALRAPGATCGQHQNANPSFVRINEVADCDTRLLRIRVGEYKRRGKRQFGIDNRMSCEVNNCHVR